MKTVRENERNGRKTSNQKMGNKEKEMRDIENKAQQANDASEWH